MFLTLHFAVLSTTQGTTDSYIIDNSTLTDSYIIDKHCKVKC